MPKKRSKTGGTLLILLVMTGVAALVATRMTPALHAPQPRTHKTDGHPAEAPETGPLSLPVEPNRETLEGRVQQGQSISSLLGEYLSSREIHELAARSRSIFPLRKVRAGHPYRIHLLDGGFQRFEYEIDADRILVFQREPEALAVSTEPIHYEEGVDTVEGSVETSLFVAVEAAGEKPELALRLAEIFAWDVDFMLDVRQGDSFRAIVEKRYRDGEFAGYGRVLAAEFINQGTVHRGFLFENDAGRPEYYSAQGRNLRKAFLKTPLRFTRISSGFSHSRLHPILNVRRPHPGVDYAAPTGTPVKTVGDGVVTARAYDPASGNYVKVRHSSVYETAYLHLSRFAQGIQAGKRVRQGQVIGYVGSTGLATGPHLDFRVKKNGQYVNPKTLKAPDAPPLAAEKREAFQRTMEPLAARLDAGRSFAKAGDGTADTGRSDPSPEPGVH